MSWLQPILQWLGENKAWFFYILFLVGGFVVHVLTANIYKYGLSRIKIEKHGFLSPFIASTRKPIVYLIWFLVIMLVVTTYLDQVHEVDHLRVTNSIRSLGITILSIWTIARFITNIQQSMLKGYIGKKNFDQTTVDGVGKFARIVLFFVAALAILQTFGVPLAAIYTAAGGAGIGITLAAQDILKNLFGGLILYFDRPFSIGDWISSPDKTIEGTVMRIGWRTTEIKTFASRPLYVPNSTFLAVSVENPSRMLFRRISTSVGVRYDDFKVLPKITDDIEKMLRADDDIAQDQSLFVNLVQLADSSLNITIYCFTKTKEWIPFQRIQQRVLLKTLEIVEAHGAEAAFPTQTVHMPDGLMIKKEDTQNVTTAAN